MTCGCPESGSPNQAPRIRLGQNQSSSWMSRIRLPNQAVDVPNQAPSKPVELVDVPNQAPESGSRPNQAPNQASTTVIGAPRSEPSPAAALPSARAISSTPKELIRARYSPGRALPYVDFRLRR